MKEESFLAISGYDPSGGAGVIADSQVSSYFGIPFCSLLTCISNQDTSSVHTVQPMDKSFMLDVAERIKEDRNIKYIKIGLIPNAELVECIIDIIESFFDDAKIILDPVIKPTGKGQLQSKTEVSAYTKLLTKAWLVTPNEYELKKLSQKESIEEAIATLKNSNIKNILCTGIVNDSNITNILYSDIEHIFTSKLIPGSFRGTGCTFSSAITCKLISGLSLVNSISDATKYTHQCIKESKDVGSGSRILCRNP